MRFLFGFWGVLRSSFCCFYILLGFFLSSLGQPWEPFGAILGRLGAKLKPLRVLFGLLGAPLGASWSLLGRSWAEIGWSWGDLWGTSIYYYFLERFREQKGCPKGRIWGAKTEQKSIKKRGANLRAKKSPLGVVLVRFGVDFQGVLGSKLLICHWLFKVFRENQRFW